MVAWLRRGGGKPHLKIGHSLGAFARPGQGDISPLYVFFEVSNAGRDAVEISRLYAAPKGGGSAYEGPFEGDRDLPCTLGREEAVRFWVRAKALAKSLEDAGHGGRPRVEIVVEDTLGNVHKTSFRFRVDEYLRLKDE